MSLSAGGDGGNVNGTENVTIAFLRAVITLLLKGVTRLGKFAVETLKTLTWYNFSKYCFMSYLLRIVGTLKTISLSCLLMPDLTMEKTKLGKYILFPMCLYFY